MTFSVRHHDLRDHVAVFTNVAADPAAAYEHTSHERHHPRISAMNDDPHIDRRLELMAELNDIAVRAREIVEELTGCGLSEEQLRLVQGALKMVTATTGSGHGS
jgi:hypothetical protein